MKPTLVVICGPTAVGKTSFAIDIANELNTEIISADSRQFFKELNIGTAKPTKEELSLAKHHFVNNKSITDKYNANDFEKEVLAFLKTYFSNNNVAILVGGSGLYIDAVCNGFDSQVPNADPNLRAKLEDTFKKEGIEALHKILNEIDANALNKVDKLNSKRLIRAIEICKLTNSPLSDIRKGERQERFFNCIHIGLELPREDLYNRINNRVDKMIEEGLIEEAQSVYHLKDNNALKTVGYKELFDYFEKKTSLAFAFEKIKINSRRYAKRQMTWFKKNERIRWFSPNQLFEVITYIRNNEQS